jgi:hypothetical protein
MGTWEGGSATTPFFFCLVDFIIGIGICVEELRDVNGVWEWISITCVFVLW